MSFCHHSKLLITLNKNNVIFTYFMISEHSRWILCDWAISVFFKYFIYYLFGCVGPSLWHTGLWGTHTVSSCGSEAQWLRITGFVALQDTSSPTRDHAHGPCTSRRILNHGTTREIPSSTCFNTRSYIDRSKQEMGIMTLNLSVFNSILWL